MLKWILVLALVILAPTFVINLFSNGVMFVSNQGKALTSEVVKEANKTIQEANQK
jgi:hypothetical protein